MPKEDLGVSENLEQQSLTYTLYLSGSLAGPLSSW